MTVLWYILMPVYHDPSNLIRLCRNGQQSIGLRESWNSESVKFPSSACGFLSSLPELKTPMTCSPVDMRHSEYLLADYEGMDQNSKSRTR